MKVTIKDLEAQVGTLSNPSKMPGYAWGIPAKHCKRGSKLRQKAGTVCSKCYALKNLYMLPNVQESQENRLRLFKETDRNTWVEAMAALISRRVKPDDPYFRIFDSGDLQSQEMLKRWVLVAILLPDIQFWLSTRERAIVNRTITHQFPQPANLVIRVSADMVDGPVPTGFRHTSGVANLTTGTWAHCIDANRLLDTAHYCPAPLQDNECGDCRVCWDLKVETVVYKEH